MILTLGCSNGQHFEKAFQQITDKKIMNLSAGAFGNTYISTRLFEFLSKTKPDFVYLQFTGVLRVDMPFDKRFNITNYPHQVQTPYHNWVGSGGMKGPWLRNNFTEKHFGKLHDVLSNSYHGLILSSMKNIFSAIELCKSLSIPFAWTTYYDYLNPPNDAIKLNDGIITSWPDYIDMENMLPESPLNYSYKIKEYPDDEVHFTQDTFVKYLNKHKKQIAL